MKDMLNIACSVTVFTGSYRTNSKVRALTNAVAGLCGYPALVAIIIVDPSR